LRVVAPREYGHNYRVESKMALPDVFSFNDYRAYLAEYYRVRKASDRKFSHRFIAGQVHAKSAGWFADIVQGRISLTGGHLSRLIHLLKLPAAEADYFETLVHLDQAASTEEKTRYYKRLLAIKGIDPEIVGKDRFEFYSEWYHAVIRELLFIYEFRGDYPSLAKKLSPSIGASEARKSVRLLESLGFLAKKASGGFAPIPATLKKDSTFKSVHLESFLRAYIRLGGESLESVPKEERDISTMTLSLSGAGFAKAKEEIRALRNRLMALMESDQDPEKVYQCNFQLFPVTR
jgi:uncharacterized protein (TIGR02147 family)